MNIIRIQFLGASGIVTGSKFLITAFGKKILIDCGFFQGLKEPRKLNWQPLTVSAKTIDTLILTQANLDHTGYLPLIVKQGFAGPIWGTAPTLEIAKIILEDSAKIQEEDAARANAKGYSKHKPAQPLYNLKDVEKTLPHFNPQPLDIWIEISEGISCRFKYNSHIIGATFIELKIGDKTIVFSGDIGRDNDLLMYPPQKPETADILFIESTYGDRLHPNHSETQLEEIINTAAKMNGTIIVPGFAVERIQMLMYLLWQLKKKGKIPAIPIYMDSPMGRNVLDIFHHNTSWHKLSADEYSEMYNTIRRIKGVDETLVLAADKQTKIIIAGSRMAAGGRVLTNFEKYLNFENVTILLVGFQVEGTRVRSLPDGATEIKRREKSYTLKAHIENIKGLSHHATNQVGLINWKGNLESGPDKMLIVHSEDDGAKGLQEKAKETFGWTVNIPQLNETIQI